MTGPAAPDTSVPSARADRGRPPRFHGWRIVAVLAVTETVSWGILYYAYAVVQVPMGLELGASPAVLAGAFSLAVLLTGLAAVPVGRWLDVRGPRGLMTAGAIACTLLVAAWSQVHTVTGLYLVMAGIGLARAAVLYDPAFAVIVRWFHARRSTALLAVTVVAGFASTIALPASQSLIEALGWRRSLLVLAGVLATVTILPHWLVLRAHPADLGLHPDGADHPPPPHPAELIDAHAAGLTATATWALRDPCSAGMPPPSPHRRRPSSSSPSIWCHSCGSTDTPPASPQRRPEPWAPCPSPDDWCSPERYAGSRSAS